MILNRLFQPVSNASLIFFRIVFGVLAFADITAIFTYYHLHKDSFNPDKFQFKYYGFEWVQPFYEPFMSLFFISLLVAAACIILGRYYRVATLYYALGFSYCFFLEKEHYLNHAYAFMWLGFIMFFLPAHRNFSWDALAAIKKRNTDFLSTQMPYWCLFVLQFLMAVIYFYGGIAKMNADWLLKAQPLKIWLKYKSSMPIVGPFLELEFTAWFMSIGGFCLDFFVVFFLVNKRTRPYAYAAVIFFHIMNTIVFKIGIFPWLSLGLTALFFAPNFPLKVNDFLKNRFNKFHQIEAWWNKKITGVTVNANAMPWRMRRKWVLLALIPVCLFHLSYPFRHHLLKGDVAWTEEGHRYSWRMMLRSKNGYGNFTLVDKATGKEERIRPGDYLSKKQKPKLYTHPDMILQFAHYLRDKWKTEKGKE